MLGNQMEYEISLRQMQYDANDMETDKKKCPCFIHPGGNGPRKCRKHQSKKICNDQELIQISHPALKTKREITKYII